MWQSLAQGTARSYYRHETRPAAGSGAIGQLSLVSSKYSQRCLVVRYSNKLHHLPPPPKISTGCDPAWDMLACEVVFYDSWLGNLSAACFRKSYSVCHMSWICLPLLFRNKDTEAVFLSGSVIVLRTYAFQKHFNVRSELQTVAQTIFTKASVAAPSTIPRLCLCHAWAIILRVSTITTLKCQGVEVTPRTAFCF